MGVSGSLGVVFVALKLLEVIDWSWWWVTTPFWIEGAMFSLVGAHIFFMGRGSK